MNDLTAVSLFAGIGGIDEALRRAGVRVAAAVEIDPACRGVLARHFPGTALFNDVTEVTGDQLIAAGFVPGRGILAGGSPCQDFSISGRRAGLGGARSGLFWHIMRLADELRPRWLVFENVDGLLSSVCSCPGNEACTDNGRSVQCGRWDKQHGERVFIPHVTHTPEGGACPGGCMGLHGGAMGTVLGAVGKRWDGVAYRVLDAQHFGVPQRRNRVFIVGCAGDRAAPAEVLLEPEGGAGNPAQGRAAGAGIAGAIGGRSGGSRSTGLDGHGAYVADPLTTRPYADQASAERQLVTTLQGGGRRGHRIDAESAAGGHLIPVDLEQSGPFASRAVSPALTARDAKGPDSDMTSGFIAVPVALRGREGGSAIECGQPGDPAFTLRTPGGGSSHPLIATSLTAGSASPGVSIPGGHQEDDVNLVAAPQCVTGSVTHALTSEGADASEDGTGRGSPLGTVTSGEPRPVPSCAVRRLTPLERERLQGFEDEWTRWRLEDGELIEQSDSARDRQTGNAVAIPVVEWIARRLVAADAEARGEKSGAA